ncbi:tetratricopeptide repeat protein [Thalassospiraceae bacterium LMO-JJ14]|nr:tetratricopeptide repeat protein [Thalassospiraceae bacterium LMO-JJ14]
MNERTFEPDSPEPEVKAAYALYKRAEFVNAVTAARENMQACADKISLSLVLALSLRRLGRQNEALAVLRETLEAAPGRADIWTLQGMCQRDLGAREQAQISFRSALKADESYVRARYHLAVVTQEMGHDVEAVPLFKWYLQTDTGGRNALAWSLLGVSHRRLKQFKESVQAMERAIALNPTDIPTRNALVITHFQAGNEAECVKAAAVALEMKDAFATAQFARLDLGLELTHRDAPFDPLAREKNIISFSLWGDDPVYTHGAIVNAQIAPHIYPSWRCRFYCDDSVPAPVIEELRRLGAEIHIIRDPKIVELKPLWRFLVSDDATVERFICRDADSRLNMQEAVAVDDWIKSGRLFHVMRDHPYHMEVILAGMWGGVTRVLPNIRALAGVAMGYSRNKWNDQEFLRDVVWPLIRDHAQVHDSVFRFRGADDFPPACRLPGQIHVGGAVKSMPPWPVPAWFSSKNG